MVVVTGPNGGGKTTLAKLIAGIVKPASGRILLDGEDITDANVTERAKKGIAYAFQQPVKFKGLTVRDLLELSSGGALDHDGICQLLGNVGLCADEYIDREMSAALSGGESKRIEIATVLARNAKLSIFDEPEAGIDLWSFAKLTETFRAIHQKREATLIVISHQERIIDLADEIVMIRDGKIAKHGPKDEIFPQDPGQHLGRVQLYVGGGEVSMDQAEWKLLKEIAELEKTPRGGLQHPPQRRAGLPEQHRQH